MKKENKPREEPENDPAPIDKESSKTSPDSQVAVMDPPGELAASDLMSEMVEDEGKGTDSIGPRDMALPFLTILQKNHPQCEEGNEKRIEGARPGMFMDTVMGDIYPGHPGLEVILCGSKRVIVEWKDRDAGGGLVGQHSMDSDIIRRSTRNSKGKMVLSNGNILMETVYHFLLVKDPNTGLFREMVFPMVSTFLKESRRWMTLIKMRTATIGKKTFHPPMFGQRFLISTVLTKKNQYTWQIPVISPMDELVSDPETYHRAKALNKLIEEGKVAVSAPPIDHSDYESEGSEESEENDPPF